MQYHVKCIMSNVLLVQYATLFSCTFLTDFYSPGFRISFSMFLWSRRGDGDVLVVGYSRPAPRMLAHASFTLGWSMTPPRLLALPSHCAPTLFALSVSALCFVPFTAGGWCRAAPQYHHSSRSQGNEGSVCVLFLTCASLLTRLT